MREGSSRAAPAGTGDRARYPVRIPRDRRQAASEAHGLEETAKRIGFDESRQLMYRRGGFAVLVKRTAKYEIETPDGLAPFRWRATRALLDENDLRSPIGPVAVPELG
jgi:hypothetical protein